MSPPTSYFDPVVSGLAGGGEIVTLADAADVVIDSVTYDDVVPWPIAPDGGGPSLELIDPFSDNGVGPSWAASTGTDGTPQAQNSVFNAPPPSLNITATPFRPNAGQAVTVQASAPGASAATLTYKVMFGSDVPVAMTDGGGGTFSAVIPGQAAGSLIRFKVSATVGAGTLTHPVAGDSRGYDGVVVKDPALNSAQLPVLEWFIDDAGYNGLLQPFCDQVEYPGVITWQGQVFDNANFRRRGHGSCNDPKPKVEMQLPAGYAIDFSSVRLRERGAVHRPARRVGAAERVLPDPRPRLGEHPPGRRPGRRLHAGAGPAQRRVLRRQHDPGGVRRVLAQPQGLRQRRLLQGRGRRAAHLLDPDGAVQLGRLRQEGP